jgi:hypothetical protein
MDITLIPDEVKSLITVLKGQIFLVGKDWDNLRDPEREEICLSAVETITKLNNLVRGDPNPAPLRVIG